MRKKDIHNNFSESFSKAFRSVISDALLTKTPATINNWKSFWKSYVVFLRKIIKRDTLSLCAEDFSAEAAKKYMDYLREKGNKPQSINQKISTIRTILKDIGAKDYKFSSFYSQWSTLPQLKHATGYKDDVLSEKAIETILKTLLIGSSPIAHKYYLMCALGYYTATRIDEILSLHVSDAKINDPNPCIIVVGKGRKTRACPIDKKLAKTLQRYVVNNNLQSGDYLFARKNDNSNKLTSQGVNKYLKKIAHSAQEKCDEVPLSLHFHQFRKARATHLLNHKVPIEQICEFLGHENINTTMTYLGITLNMKYEAINQILPNNVRSEEPRYSERDIQQLFGL